MAKMFPCEFFAAKMASPNCGYSKRAFVTFLAGSGDYVKGVIGLAKGLRKAKSLYPLVVAVLPDVPEDHRLQLRNQGCIVREIEPINPPENQLQFAMAYYVLNYSKLRIWEVNNFTVFWGFSCFLGPVFKLKFWGLGFVLFEEFSKMVYLDADIQVFDNIDNLFDMPDGYFYAVMDCFCEKTWNHTTQCKIGYCQQCPNKVTWPAELEEERPALYFNAGMFVFEPSKLTFESMMETLMSSTPTPFAEQVISYLLCSIFA